MVEHSPSTYLLSPPMDIVVFIWTFDCNSKKWFLLFYSQSLFCSTKNSSNLQHWDEVQDEGAHDGRWRHLLEVDFGEHDRAGDGNNCLPLEHGGRFPACKNLRQALLPCWLSGTLDTTVDMDCRFNCFSLRSSTTELMQPRIGFFSLEYQPSKIGFCPFL